MKKSIISLFCLMLIIAAFTGNVWANTAANTQIVNTAILTFNGGSASASVTVSVALVQVAPTVSLTGGTAVYTAPNTPVIYETLVLTSNANGPATYHVTAAMGSGAQAPVNTTGASVSDGGGFDVVLGASVATDGATVHNGGNTLIIPAPDAAHITGSGATLTVNGISQGSVIVFSGSVTSRTVTSIASNADGNYTVTFDGAAVTPVTAGTPVFEQRTFNSTTASNIRALPGTVTSLGSHIHVYAQATVTNSTFTTTSTWADNDWTTDTASVSFHKYVRNATTDGSVVGTPASRSFTINGTSHTYYVSTSATSGITAKPGESLEYVIEARNTSATSALTGCAISDLVPVAYVDFSINVYGANNVFYIAPDNSTASFTAAGIGVNQASFVAANNPNLIVNVGNGASNILTGTIPANEAVVIAYQVVVKP